MAGFSAPAARVALACLLLATSCAVTLASDAATTKRHCSATLTQVAEMETQGNSGFESWWEDEDNFRLFAANLWDGVSPNMASSSWIYNVTSAPKGGLNVVPLQRLSTMGATEARMIWGYGGRPMLLINNHLRCGDKEEALHKAAPCGPTSLYMMNGPLWEDFKSLKTSGPLKTDWMIVGDNKMWLIVVEGFKDRVSIWNYDSVRMEWNSKFALGVPNPTDAVITIHGGSMFVTACSKIHPETEGRATSCPMFSLIDQRFHQLQNLPSFGASDLEQIEYEGTIFLFIANERTDEDHRIDSQIYTFQGMRWAHNQSIPTEGAKGGHFFVKEGELWLGIANFGDLFAGKVKSESNLWKFNKETKLFDKMAEVDSFGATAWKYFSIGGYHYAALANQGHLTNQQYQTSYVYRLDEECKEVPKKEL